MPQGAKRLPQPLVDFHDFRVHLFPDQLFDAIRRRFVTDYGWSILHRFYWRECVAYLRERGVGPVVCSNDAHRKGVAPFRKLLPRYPNLPAIIAHMGALEYGAFGELLVAHPRLYQTRP